MRKSLALLLTMICIYALFRYPYHMVNPGEIIKGHQKIKADCSACHTFFKGVSSEKCIVCHKVSEIGLLSKIKIDSTAKLKNILFHQHLIGQKCTPCHSDHKGINPDAGISVFSHDMLDAALKNECSNCHTASSEIHTLFSKDCGKCHNTTAWKKTNFNHSMLQVSAENCSRCHQEPDKAYHNQFGSNCLQCHNTNKWVPSTFDHSKYFQLDEKHNAGCTACHTDNKYKTYTCYGCHEHTQSNMFEKHNEHGIKNFNNCVACHKSANEHDIEGGENSDGKEKHNKNKDYDDD